MANRNPPEDRLDDLRKRVAKARGETSSTSQPPDSAASLALRFGGEFGAAILVGALLGYGVDFFIHTSPWGLVAKGYRTRHKKKHSNRFIMVRRDGRPMKNK